MLGHGKKKRIHYICCFDFQESSELSTISKAEAEKNFSSLSFLKHVDKNCRTTWQAMVTELAWEIQSWGKVKKFTLY